MTPYYSDPWLTVYHGDARAVMAELPAESVHCVVTSPPYWGLRDYGTAAWTGGDEACDHVQRTNKHGGTSNRPGLEAQTYEYRHTCGKCGARRIDSQLGLEPTPEQYVENMVAVFREVRRVLRSDGTVWLNLGDSYASGGIGRRDGGRPEKGNGWAEYDYGAEYRQRDLATGLKPKDLVGIPWRVAFALQQPYYTGDISDERDRTWLAALMDGEGTFTILSTTSSSAGSVSYPPIAQVRMTSAGVVGKAASLVGVMSPAQYPPSGGNNRAVYQWRLAGGRAASVARELYPYLIEKRRQAMVAWNHQQVRDGYTTKRGVGMPDEARAKQQLCRDIIRRLNRGEHVDLPSWMVEPPGLTEPGWYLRSDVIWSKPNPMPESVTDRPTKSHEYLFLLSKSARYYYDAAAVAEASIRAGDIPGGGGGYSGDAVNDGRTRAGMAVAVTKPVPPTRNLRSVWSIATAPYPGAHFATFPPKLVEPCIKAGTSEKGVCPECGAPWVRVVERESAPPEVFTKRNAPTDGYLRHGYAVDGELVGGGQKLQAWRDAHPPTTTGWRPSCSSTCDYAEVDHQSPVPATVLDPFAGSGTTGMVAQSLSRRAVLIDLSMDYLGQLMDRNRQPPLGLPA